MDPRGHGEKPIRLQIQMTVPRSTQLCSPTTYLEAAAETKDYHCSLPTKTRQLLQTATSSGKLSSPIPYVVFPFLIHPLTCLCSVDTPEVTLTFAYLFHYQIKPSMF